MVQTAAPPSGWRDQVSEETVRNYAAGKISWREIRHKTDLDDFQVMLIALGDLDLKLPRAAPDRATAAKAMLAAALARAKEAP